MTAPAQVAADMARALEVGDWSRLAPRRLQPLLDEPGMRSIVPAMVATASSMRRQAEGDVESAADCLHEAAAHLPITYRRRERRFSGTRLYANLTPPPEGDPIHVLRTIWRVARVIARDQAGLAEHEAALMRGRITQREALVLATVEFLRWVDCDPYLPGRGPAFAHIDMQLRCTSALARTTNLNRLADPTAPDVGEGVWRGAGGEAHLKAAAYVRLSRADLVPTRGDGALPPDVPVRSARVEAHRRACRRRDYRAYT